MTDENLPRPAFKLPIPSTNGGSPPRTGEFPTASERLWRLASLPLLLFFAIPIIALFLRISPLDWWQSLHEESLLNAVRVSLTSSLISLAVIVITGTPLAYLISRPRFRFKNIIDTIVDLPTVLPPSVAGVALLITLGRQGLLGQWLSVLGIQLPFTLTAVIIAQVFIAAPFFVRSAAVGFSAVDDEIVQAAQLDGANRFELMRYIYLPLAQTALISGGVMSWSRALGEFGATILFAGNFPGRTQTMPMAIYLGFEVDLNLALTLSVILVSISFIALLLVKRLVQSR